LPSPASAWTTAAPHDAGSLHSTGQSPVELAGEYVDERSQVTLEARNEAADKSKSRSSRGKSMP
jgi:hypothetical protein